MQPYAVYAALSSGSCHKHIIFEQHKTIHELHGNHSSILYKDTKYDTTLKKLHGIRLG